MVEGTKKLIDKNFKLTPPTAVNNAITNYREETDWLAQFIDECCDIDINASTPSNELFKAYAVFCISTCEFKHHQKDFIAALRLKGFDKKRTNKCNVILGIKLKDDKTF